MLSQARCLSPGDQLRKLECTSEDEPLPPKKSGFGEEAKAYESYGGRGKLTFRFPYHVSACNFFVGHQLQPRDSLKDAQKYVNLRFERIIEKYVPSKKLCRSQFLIRTERPQNVVFITNYREGGHLKDLSTNQSTTLTNEISLFQTPSDLLKINFLESV